MIIEYICGMDTKLVIIPTYNEIENVEKIIKAVLALEEGFDILIIDDGSPDGTAAAVKRLQAQFEGRLPDRKVRQAGARNCLPDRIQMVARARI